MALNKIFTKQLIISRIGIRTILGGPGRNQGELPRKRTANAGFLEDDVEKRQKERLQSLNKRQKQMEINIDMVRSMTYKAQNENVNSYLSGSKERMSLEAKLKDFKCKLHNVPIVIDDCEYTCEVNEHFQKRPFDHKSSLSRYFQATPEQIEASIKSNLCAHRCWERRPIEERAEILLRAGELVAGKYRYDIMAATILGQAKTIIDAEVDAACQLADYYRFSAQWALELHKWQPINTCVKNEYSYRGCEGFWAAVTPFNYTSIAGNVVAIPALMGNTVTWKPNKSSILSSYIIYKILREAGMPPGVINFVPCQHEPFIDVITKHERLAGINFSGTTKSFLNYCGETSKRLSNYMNFPRLIGDCSSKNFFISDVSAEQEDVVCSLVRAAFEYAGQKCGSVSRLYIPQSRWVCVKDALCEEMRKIKIGSPLIAENYFSAVINREAFDRAKSYIEYAKNSEDCSLICGGRCDDAKGYFVEPTLILTKNPNDKLLTDEILAPILTAYVYPDLKLTDMLNTINSTSRFGLTGCVYSCDDKMIEEAKDMLRYSTGNLFINGICTQPVVSQQPFSGARLSGTNDKPGSPHYLLKFVSPLNITENEKPLEKWDYPYMLNQ